MDEVAFESLVRTHERQVRSFIAGLGIPLDAVDDLAQDVFLDRYQQREDPEGCEATWLRAMARNKARQWFRRASRQRRLRERFARQMASCADRPGMPRADDLLENLQVCLAGMPQQQRQLLERYYSPEETAATIAADLGRGLSALRMQMLTLRESLRRCVETRLGQS